MATKPFIKSSIGRPWQICMGRPIGVSSFTLAFRCGIVRDRSTRRWIQYPLALLTAPIALAFVLILTLSLASNDGVGKVFRLYQFC